MNFELIGAIPSKKNTWKVNKYGKVYQSKQEAIDGLLTQLVAQKREYTNPPIKTNCMLLLKVYGDNRNDLDNQITSICDLLQKGGVVVNDRLIKRIDAEKFIDRKTPRAEISII